MANILREMKIENKHDQTIRTEDLDIGMEYTIIGMNNVTNIYEYKLVTTVDFKGETVDLFAHKCFDSKAADLEKEFQK